MVGVPGRSKACLTCKKRRRGCDSLRPRCTPCRKSGIECGGYEAPRVFVNSSKETWPRGSAYTNTLYRRPNSTRSGHPTVWGQIIHSQSLAQTAYVEQNIHVFLEAYLPRGIHHDQHGPRWTSVVRETCRDNEALTFALLANGLAAVGTRDGKAWLVWESFKLYGKALEALNKSLRLPTRGDSSLLSAARLLSTFEMFVGSDHDSSISRCQNWESHVNGDLALLKARGPDAFIHGDAHTIFADGRLHYYIMSAKQRRQLFVNEPAWKTVPWTGVPKTRRDLLLDLLLDIPGILEDYDRLSSCPNDTTRVEQREALVARCWELDEGLQGWAASSSRRIDHHNIFTGSVEGPSPASCQDMPLVEMEVLYWSGCLLLYSTLELALGPDKAGTLPERADHTIYMRNIAWAIQPLLDPQAGMFGRHVAAFPLAMALQFVMISPEPREPPSEVRDMLVESLKGPGGEGIRGFILSMNTHSSRHPPWMNEIPGPAGISARARRWAGVRDVPEDWQGWLKKDATGSDGRSRELPCEVHRLLYGHHLHRNSPSSV